LIVYTVNADTELGGQITENRTLTVTESPYWVTEDVTVTPGVTLTIEAGVTIEFIGDTSLIIEGSLSAIGTSQNYILFTAQDQRQSWNTILFRGREVESFLIQYAIIREARYGITISSDNSENVLIEDCEIHSNSEGGIRIVENNLLVIRNNIIRDNKVGIVTDADEHYSVEISNNLITSNEKDGISFSSSIKIRYDNDWDLILFSNTISNNGENGISFNINPKWRTYLINLFSYFFYWCNYRYNYICLF